MKSFIKLFDKIIIMLLSITGFFTACKPVADCNFNPKPNPYSNLDSIGIPEYGVPLATFEIIGTVTDDTHLKPVPNIQITRQILDHYADTLYTDLQGNYIYSSSKSWLSEDNPVHLKFQDIDGEENGGRKMVDRLKLKKLRYELQTRKGKKFRSALTKAEGLRKYKMLN
jgi:putative lipoprotein (rSAM/lipoprotein system)